MVPGRCWFFLAQMNANICRENNNKKIAVVIIIIIYLYLSRPAASPPLRFGRSW